MNSQQKRLLEIVEKHPGGMTPLAISQMWNMLEIPAWAKILHEQGKPTTLVLDGGDIPMGFYEEHHEYCNWCTPDETGEYPNECYCEIFYYGSWAQGDGGMSIDETGEYAAVYNSNHNTLQIVWSQWIVQGKWAFQGCYPGQAIPNDDNSNGDIVLSYGLPPNMYYEEGDQEIKPVYVNDSNPNEEN